MCKDHILPKKDGEVKGLDMLDKRMKSLDLHLNKNNKFFGCKLAEGIKEDVG